MDDATTIKRPHYFKGMFLGEEDFTSEQEYHIARRRLHNRLMHSWGIASGLKIEFTSGATAVTVSPGVAIDGAGREILLPAIKTIELSSHPASTALCITVAYEEVLSDPPTDDDEGKNHTRYTEQAVFQAAAGLPSDPDKRLVLGVVQRDAQKTVTGVETSARRFAGVGGGSLSVRELTLSDPTIAEQQWARMRLRAARTVTLDGALEVTDAIKPATGNAPTAGIQFTPSAPGSDDQAFIRYFSPGGDTSRLLIGIGNDPDDRLSFMQAGAERVTITSGNVGIGTQSPLRALHVEGTEIHVSGQSGGYSFNDRTTGFVQTPAAGQRWVWYAESGTARLWSGKPLLTVTHAGALATIGGYTCGGDIDMTGDIKGAGGLTISSTGTLHLSAKAGVEMGKDANSSGDLTMAGNLFVNGQVTTKGGLQSNGLIQTTGGAGISVDGGITVKGQFNPKGLSLFDGDVLMAGFRVVGNAKVDNLLTVGTLSVTHNAVVNGTLTAKSITLSNGTKSGYVIDHFVNNLKDPLEQGDIVVVNPNGVAVHYGDVGQVPVPEVDLTDQVYDPRVCGIVDTVQGEMTEATPEGKPRARKKIPQRRLFDDEELAELDTTKVTPGQVGGFVTLGAYSYCKVDASIAPIETGDLLTTSPTKGHAQKVLDREKATGAIIGKALGPLAKGKAKIPVLVTLH